MRSGITNLNAGKEKRCGRGNCKRKKKVTAKQKRENKRESDIRYS